VHVEDLVLHDAGMDIRTPTHELTRAHAVLRARRRIAASDPALAISASGLSALCHDRERPDEEEQPSAPLHPGEGEVRDGEGILDDDAFAAE
ncbi:hypothetical protein ELI71_31825, partial [Klebsiella pneumoniae]|nr:hypothetical protein [Klebsiella pneumoniae]